MNSKEDIEHWTKLGNSFGYPKCCIEHFCATEFTAQLEYYQGSVFDGSGFVPCPECNEKPWMELIAQINGRRDMTTVGLFELEPGELDG